MLMLDESGSLYYQIFSGGNEIVRSSLMGVVAENGKYCFDSGLVYVDQTGRTINETYTLPTGKRCRRRCSPTERKRRRPDRRRAPVRQRLPHG